MNGGAYKSKKGYVSSSFPSPLFPFGH